MRPILYVLTALVVMGLAFWAYRQNYATQNSLKQVAKIQREIGNLHEQMAMQQAEWAYENRPSRLRDLAILNFDKLHLLPMTPDQFGDIAEVQTPAALTSGQPLEIGRPTDTAADIAAPPPAAGKPVGTGPKFVAAKKVHVP